MTAPAPAASARPSSTNTRVLGGLLLVFGSGWMLKQTGVIDLPWTALASLVLIALGLAMVVTARTRARSMPLIALGAVLTIGLAVGSSNISIRGGIGDRTYTPTVLQANREYRLGVGQLTLDLTKAALEPGETTIKATVAIGEIDILVPEGVAIRVEADARLGSAEVRGDRLDIHGRQSDVYESPGYDKADQRLRIKANVGVGKIEVTD